MFELYSISAIRSVNLHYNIYKNINSPKIPERYRKLLVEHKEDAFFSKKLATLIKDVPIDFDLEEARLKGYDVSVLMTLFQELEFKSLIAKIPKDFHKDKALKSQGAFDFESTPQLVKNNQADYRLITNQKDFEEFFTKTFCFFNSLKNSSKSF